jgi:hypothetical protein
MDRDAISKETLLDGPRFDALVRSLGNGTRRSALQLLAGTSLGAVLLGRLGIEDASAGCVAPGKKCKKKNGKKKKCCGGAKCQGKKCKCTNGGVGCGKVCCIPGQECQDGICVCLNGGVGCGDTCCIPGQLCVVNNGVPGCSNGLIPVGGACDAEQPGACTSGVCGCVGDNCTCRNADCVGPNGDCSLTGNAGCCQLLCEAGDFTCAG